MESERKMSFAANLKANNIAVSIVSLNEYSDQILLLLKQIRLDGNNEIAQKNLDSVLKTVSNKQESPSLNVLEEYIKFGERFMFLLNNTYASDDNLKLFKQIAIYYLDIAKILKDERVNKLSFSIADKLIQNDNQ